QPITNAPGFFSLTSSALASASTSATSSGVAPLPSNGASSARSSTSAGTASNATPAFASNALRNGLPEANMILSVISRSERGFLAWLTRLVAQGNDGGGGFLD